MNLADKLPNNSENEITVVVNCSKLQEKALVVSEGLSTVKSSS